MEGAGGIRGERLKRGVARELAVDADLVGVLQRGEEKQFVLLDGSADFETRLTPRKKGTCRLGGHPLQVRIRREVVVPVEEEDTAVKIVGAPARGDIDGAACADGRGKVHV